ncbi:hypothetical protein JNW90_27835, partial [Micromonospora sp. STR1s_5]|nr:hypothetical protein [Micromonospora sp. STR1s_5]
MLLAYPFRVLVPRRAAPEAATSVAVALLLLAGSVDLVPPSVVIALAAGAGATLAGLRLSRLASRRGTDPTPRAAGVLLDAAVVAAGLTAVVLPLAGIGHTLAVLIGSLVVAALSTAGLYRLPGRSRPAAPVRLRWLVESTGPAVGLALAGWLLLPPDGLPVPVRLVCALTLGGLGMAALNAFAGPRRRSGAALCRGGVLLTVGGLVLLATLPSAPAAGWHCWPYPRWCSGCCSSRSARRMRRTTRSRRNRSPRPGPGRCSPRRCCCWHRVCTWELAAHRTGRACCWPWRRCRP